MEDKGFRSWSKRTQHQFKPCGREGETVATCQEKLGERILRPRGCMGVCTVWPSYVTALRDSGNYTRFNLMDSLDFVDRINSIRLLHAELN